MCHRRCKSGLIKTIFDWDSDNVISVIMTFSGPNPTSAPCQQMFGGGSLEFEEHQHVSTSSLW